MRIAFLSTFFPYPGDISVGNTKLYRVLEKSNEIKAFNFSLLYPDLLFPGKEKYVSKNEVFDMISSERVLNTANPASYFYCADAINKYQPNIMISRYWMPYLGASIGGTAKFLKKSIKKIAMIDSMRASKKIVLEEQANELFVKSFDAFIVMNNQVKEDLLAIKPDAFFHEHPQPFFSQAETIIDKKIARKILNIPQNKKIMLLLGEVREYRGIDIILNSLVNLDESYHLVVAGRSPSGFDFYNKKIKDLKLTDKITPIIRDLNYNEFPYLFSASDVLLIPLKIATSKEIISQTFSFNLPVIATDVGNFKDFYEQNEFGLIVEKPDSELFTAAIKKFYQENLNEVFIQNMNKFRYTHTWESLSTLIFDIYDKLLEEKEDETIYY